jgi:hypothetical protein
MRVGTTRLLACLCVAVALPVAAQLPGPFLSGEVRGRVVDEAGQPVEGVVVVARWEWLHYDPPRLHGGGYYVNNGEAVHVAEAVTGRSGEYSIASWGPTAKAGGKMDDGQPRLYAFKSGYEPAVGARGQALRLRKSSASPAAYAQLIRNFQEGSNAYGSPHRGGTLAWRFPGHDWRGMPRMVEAIHREKLRLGDDGASILGAHLLHGRAGEGVVLDAATRQPVQFAVVSITWTLRRSDASAGVRRVVQTKSGLAAGAKFWVSPWRVPGPRVEGWAIATEEIPLVRVYAPGYRHSADARWTETGGAVLLEKLPEGREALLAELATWRRDVDAALSQGDQGVALPLQRALLSQLAHQCNQLTPDAQQGICFPPGSDAARYLQDTRSSNVGYAIEDEEGERVMKVVAVGTGASRVQAQSVPIAPPRRVDRPAIGGFRIEPAR